MPQPRSIAAPPDIRPVRTARLLGMTVEAREALQGESVVIRRFPFRVGRESRSVLTKLSMSLERRLGAVSPLNDLYIVERTELVHVSREHFLIDVAEHGGFLLADRGSVCGTIVGGKQIGGDRTGGWTVLRDEDVIVVGRANSPYVFKFRGA